MDSCGDCNFFNEKKQMVNGSYECIHNHFTVKRDQMACHQIQFNKRDANEMIYETI